MFADLLRIIFYDPDRGWVEDSLENPDPEEEDRLIKRRFEEALE